MASNSKRAFNLKYLEMYDWMIYSPKHKGVFCKFCILFKPNVHRGKQGSFIITPFTKFYQIIEESKKHEKTQWHNDSKVTAKLFLDSMNSKKINVMEQINSSVHKEIKDNRKKLRPIIKSILFCGQHDIALRGNTADKGNFVDLLKFRIDSGDNILSNHFDTASGKSKYVSHRIQNEIIQICGQVIRNDIVSQVNNSVAFSLLADETADIAGKEQLSIGVRYIDINYVVHEEFIGFSEIHVLNAEGVSRSILESTEKYGLNMLKLVGLGFDGCSTMSGKENGVQAIIRKMYPTACYFHCASHKLNLVVNDQNSIPDIRNTIGTVKEIIKFFRESILRRKLIPNIPLFCEARWSEKYKCIRLFDKNFIEIKTVLEKLSISSEANTVTRNRAFQLSSATSNCTFLICLKVIVYYSSVLEPVVTKLQGTSVNLHSVHTFVKTELLGILNKHREHSIEYFNTIFEEITKAANSLDVVLKIPRRTNHQSQRSNHNYSSNDSIEDYYRVSMYIPYLDSIISSLNNRFNENNETPFKLCWLLPNEMVKLQKTEYINILQDIENHFKIPNIKVNGLIWYDYWQLKSQSFINDIMVDHKKLLKECEFFPAVKKGIIIYITLPPTTCTVERSFSTLRRVKTWTRSTMSEDRLDGLCMISVHREKINDKKNEYVEQIINIFGVKKRNLQFLFV